MLKPLSYFLFLGILTLPASLYAYKPGPILVVQCPGTKQALKVGTTMSGNTFSATYWTDGKLEAEMLPDRPWFLKSADENVLFFSDECKVVDEISPFGQDEVKGKKWENLKEAVEPNEEDYYHALKTLTLKKDKEFYLRKRAWWASNDKGRASKSIQLETRAAREVENMEKFYALIDSKDSDALLVKADLARQLGRFAEAKALLSSPFPDNYKKIVKFMGDLTAQKKTGVYKVPKNMLE